jgi:hypothetical protein
MARFERIALVVGNGLSLSYRASVGGALDAWNPSRPLDWPIQDPTNPSRNFLEALEELSSRLARHRAIEDHFTRIGLAAGDPRVNLRAAVEATHFVAAAYSSFEIAAQAARPNAEQWKWYRWMRQAASRVAMVVSYNYDLLLESALRAGGFPPWGFAVVGDMPGIRVLKPHGSVDLVGHESGISAPACYPLSVLAWASNVPQRRLSAKDLLRPRSVLDIVLPTHASHVSRFQWVAPGYRLFESFAPNWNHFIFAGLAYRPEDRAELDRLMRSIPVGARVSIINPSPSEDMIRALSELGHEPACFDDVPDYWLAPTS